MFTIMCLFCDPVKFMTMQEEVLCSFFFFTLFDTDCDMPLNYSFFFLPKHRSIWHSNPHFCGSYSFISKDTKKHKTNALDLATPVCNSNGKQVSYRYVFLSPKKVIENNYQTLVNDIDVPVCIIYTFIFRTWWYLWSKSEGKHSMRSQFPRWESLF